MSQRDEGETDRPRSRGFLGIALVAVPVLYVVLLGPAARVHDSCPRAIQMGLEYAYAPLEWLDGMLPARPLSRYVDLWR